MSEGIKNYQEEENKYSTPAAEQLYTGQHPDMVEFKKPWEACIQVGQGSAKISSEGEPLQSEGFSKCVAMIIQNETADEAALFHIDDMDINPDQEKILKKLMSDSSFRARFIRGTLSRDLGSRSAGWFSEKNVKIKFDDDITFDSGDVHWAIVYKPSERMIYIDVRKNKKALEFPF